MFRRFAIFAAMLCAPFGMAAGQGDQSCPKPQPAELECVLEQAWASADRLAQDKQDRLKPDLMALVAAANNEALITTWLNRLGLNEMPVERDATRDDFGWQRAAPIIHKDGIDVLIRYAEQRRKPLHFGRSDVLLSAGKHYIERDDDAALKLNQALFRLAAASSTFERPALLEAAGELAVLRCDRSAFDRAMGEADSADNLRYMLWRSRFTRDLRPALQALDDNGSGEDTRYIRQVLQGYRVILEHGYCEKSV